MIPEPYSVPADRLHRQDKVKVEIYDDNADEIGVEEITNVTEVIDAIRDAANQAHLPNDIRDYTFKVSNLTTGTVARYRVNAHHHLHLIV